MSEPKLYLLQAKAALDKIHGKADLLFSAYCAGMGIFQLFEGNWSFALLMGVLVAAVLRARASMISVEHLAETNSALLDCINDVKCCPERQLKGILKMRDRVNLIRAKYGREKL